MILKELSKTLLRKIHTLKKKHPHIYCVKCKEEYYIFRLLSRKEYNTVLELQTYIPGTEEDFIFKTCMLHPTFKQTEINNLYAGIVTGISQMIVELSGFSSSDALMAALNENRSIMELADSQITTVLCKAFPYLTPEMINEFDIQNIAYHLALAEQILGVQLNYEKPKKTTQPQDINFEEDNHELFRAESSKHIPKGDYRFGNRPGESMG